jgi:hypothetical protein
MPEPLRVLEELGAELDRVARQAPQRSPRARAGRIAAIAAAVLLGAAGISGATVYVLTGSPIPGAPDADLPIDARLQPGSARLAGAEADDPGGGPKWDLRVSRSQTGELCTAVGQVQDGAFGLVGLDGRFRELPLQGVDACGSDPQARPAFIGAREFAADEPADVRTVVNGVGGEALDDVTVQAGAQEVEVARGSGGTFVAVLRGGVQRARPTVRLRFDDGSRREYRFGQSTFVEVRDPEGEGAWTVRADSRMDGRTCAQVRPAKRLGGPIALTPGVCGRLDEDHVFFDVRPMTPGRQAPYPWMIGPRTLVWGAADETVERVEVEHAGERVRAARTAADPGILAVLPGDARPAEVDVVITFADGRRETVRGAHNLRAEDGRRLERPLLEPSTAPAPEFPRGERIEPIRGTGRIAHRERLGDLEVAVRTFATDHGRCAELGWLAADGSFGARRRDGSVAPRPLGEQGGMCAGEGAGHNFAQLLDDGSAYDPKVIGSVVWGHVTTGDRPVVIEGLERDVTARPDEQGLFLVVTEQTERPPRGVGPRESFNRGFRPDPVVPGSVRIVARAPDPAGLQPYGIMEWEQRPGTTCTHEGQIVGDVAGSIVPDPGLFHPFPMHEGGACGPAAGDPTFPVTFGFGGGIGDSGPGKRTPGEIARRTLPGRTVLSGRAQEGVRRVIVQTPRDVRAFRPGPGGAFLIVYDGTFATGTITVAAELDDGRTVRRTTEIDR